MSFLYCPRKRVKALNTREQRLVDKKVKKAEHLLLELRQVIDTLKTQIVDISKAIASKMDHAAAANRASGSSRRTSTIKALLSLQRVGVLEEKRKSLMMAIEFLQNHEIELLSQMQVVQDEQTAHGMVAAALAMQLPDLEEITKEVQRILAVKQEEGDGDGGKHQ